MRGKIKAMEKWNPLITKLEALGYIKTSNVELKTECADLKAVNKELRAGTKDLIDKQAQIEAQLEEMVGITRSFSADPGRQQVGLYGCTLQYLRDTSAHRPPPANVRPEWRLQIINGKRTGPQTCPLARNECQNL